MPAFIPKRELVIEAPATFTKLDAMRAVYLASPYFLGREILGYTKFCETQLEWSDHLTKTFNPLLPKRTWSLMLAPRETLKSTFWTVTQVIWILLNNPNLTILIANETQTGAEAFLREIKAKMESEAFRNVFGNLIAPNCDRADAMNFTTRKVYSKEANIECAGIGKSLTGRHYDIVIGDDIAGEADRDSEAKRKVTFAFLNDIMDVLKKELGYLQISGTRWHREDVYHHIINTLAPDMKRKGVGTFHLWIKPAHDPKTNKLNYPRLLPESRLLELKTVKQGKDGVDISTFMAQYELNPMSPEEQIFKTFHYTDITKNKYEQFVLWTDPALSVKTTACYSVTVVLALCGVYWDCIYASIKRRSPTDVIADHNRIYRQTRDLYKIDGDALMEDNGFQMLVQQGAVDKSVIELDPVPTVGRHNSENKHSRIRSMEPFVSQGFVRFREDWQTAPEGYALILEQLGNFPQGMIDGPDALQCAHKETQQFASFRSLNQ